MAISVPLFSLSLVQLPLNGCVTSWLLHLQALPPHCSKKKQKWVTCDSRKQKLPTVLYFPNGARDVEVLAGHIASVNMVKEGMKVRGNVLKIITVTISNTIQRKEGKWQRYKQTIFYII